MLLSSNDELKRLGLKIALSALQTYGGGFRIVGPEHQGIKKRANLWKPATYGAWFTEYRRYWDCLIIETRQWDEALRREANSAILEAAEQQLRVDAHRETILAVVEQIADDQATDRRGLHRFLIGRLSRFRDKDDQCTYHRLRRLNGKLARQNLESRFQRYILDTSWDEWEDFDTEPAGHGNSRPWKLLRALAGRVTRNDEAFEHLAEMIATSSSDNGALFTFGEALCAADEHYRRLEPLLAKWQFPDRSQSHRGYFNCLRSRNPQLWQNTLLRLLRHEETATKGAELIWGSGFNGTVFDAFLNGFESGWIDVTYLRSLSWGKVWQAVTPEQMTRLLALLAEHTDKDAADVTVELLDHVMDGNLTIDPNLLFQVITVPTHFQERWGTMHGHHWRRTCNKLVAKYPQKAMPLFDVLLQQMETHSRLSYDHYVEPVAANLCRLSPAEAWDIVARHLLSSAPKWQGSLMLWLKGDPGWFGERETLSPIVAFPAEKIFAWIAEDSESRAPMMAHSVPGTLEHERGGAVTRHLLAEYSNINGVVSGISAAFHTGGWSGPESQYLRNKRKQLRDWLSRDFEPGVEAWLTDEIVYIDQRIDAAEISEERESWRRA